MPQIVGIRFKRVGKVYYFNPLDTEFEVNDWAIVETARGIEGGLVVIKNREIDEKELVAPLKPIIRKATEDDLKVLEDNRKQAEAAAPIFKEKVKKHNLELKLVDVDYTFDKTKLIFYFSAETRVDFRELVKDLAYIFKVRIELRQIGVRDEYKAKGGLAPCGRECCCACHLGDFERVSIKMAKVQGLSLNLSKISGLCGRLMCCLQYENDYYMETTKLMPKVGSMVDTKDGEYEVAGIDILKQEIKVKVPTKEDSFEYKVFKLQDVKPEETMADIVESEEDEEEIEE